MKKFTCLILTLTLTLCSFGVFADDVSEPETPAGSLNSEAAEQAVPDSGAADEAVVENEAGNDSVDNSGDEIDRDNSDSQNEKEPETEPETETDKNSGTDNDKNDDESKGGNWAPGPMFTTGDMEARAKDNTQVIRGEDYDDVYDYNVEYTAEFTANIKNSQTAAQLSSDGNITATYYGISVSCKGKDGTPKVGRNIKLLRLQQRNT